MIDIKTYIKRDNMIRESYVVVDDIEEAESLAKRVCYGENLHIKFTTYTLRFEIFFLYLCCAVR